MIDMREIVNNSLSNIQFLPIKPRLIAKIIKNYFRLLILRKPCLRVINLALNYDCQLSCRNCSAQELKNRADYFERLSLPQIKKALQEAQKCGAINIHFTGGEPLLNKDFYKIASLVDKERNILSLVTNGILLGRESENLKKAGFDLVIVSIDSPQAERHDKLRGHQGLHQKAWEGIEAARKAGLKVMIAMIATPDNLYNGEVDEQIRLCRQKGLVLQLLPLRIAESQGGARKIWRDSKDISAFRNFVTRYIVRWDGQASYLSARCLAARERLYINPNGEVFPCDFIQICFGNIKNNSLIDIWYKMLNVYPFNQKNSACLSAFGKDTNSFCF